MVLKQDAKKSKRRNNGKIQQALWWHENHRNG